jgi:hypothetical protein
MTIPEKTKEKMEEIAAGTVMVLLSPAILAFAAGVYLVYGVFLDDDDRYTLFKKW